MVWTLFDTAPVSLLVISAEIDEDGAWSMRVMLPWTSACSTVAICDSGTFATVPTGSAARASTDVTALGIDLDDDVDGPVPAGT